MGLIFFLSSRPELPDVPGLAYIEWGDKVQHAIAYAVLGSLIWRALSRTSPKWWQIGATVALAAVYGLSDESHQLLVPNRTFDMLDLSADVLGSATAAVILTLSMGGCEVGETARRGRANLRSEGQEASECGGHDER